MSDEFDDAIDDRGHRGRVAAPAPDDDALRPRVPRLVSRLYRNAGRPLRARMLQCLLRPLGPLGLVAVASGAFADFLYRSGDRGADTALDGLGRHSSEQVFELVRFVQEVSPQAIQQLTSLLADSSVGSSAFTVAAAMLLARLVLGTDPNRVSPSPANVTLQPPARMTGGAAEDQDLDL